MGDDVRGMCLPSASYYKCICHKMWFIFFGRMESICYAHISQWSNRSILEENYQAASDLMRISVQIAVFLTFEALCNTWVSCHSDLDKSSPFSVVCVEICLQSDKAVGCYIPAKPKLVVFFHYSMSEKLPLSSHLLLSHNSCDF